MFKDESDLDQIIEIDNPPLRPLRNRQKQNKESLKQLDVEEPIQTVTYVNANVLEATDESLGQAFRFNFSQLQYIVQELLTSEISYIQMIDKGINNYLSICDGDKLPATVYGEKYHIFANIADIKNFHANVFYPSLLECGNDLELICNRFYDFIQNGDFYLYIVYAINRKRSERLCVNNQQFFLRRQQEMEDTLGIGSFLMQPIQRLPKYQLLLHQLTKELEKEVAVVEGTQEKLEICVRAEKEVQRLLDRVNSSMIINDIDDCIELRMLYPLVGKFMNQHEFDIVDADQKRRYKGKVFFFETCIVYTEAIERTKLQFRGYYMYTNIGIEYEKGKNKFFLYHKKRGNKEIECLCRSNEIPYWTESLHEVIMNTLNSRTREGYKNSVKADINCLSSQYCNVRDSVLNRQRSNSNSDNWGGSSNCTASTVDYEFQLNLRRTNWYTRVHRPAGLETIEKVIERLINSEKQYIQLLIQYMMTCLMQIPETDKSNQLFSYIQTINRIIDYHQKHLYPALMQCNGNILKVYNVFRMTLKNKEFVEVYRLYAHLACRDLVTFATRTCKRKFKNISFKHLLHYQTFLERLIFRAYHQNRSEFAVLVATNNMFAEFHYNFHDNWCLYAIKNHLPEYGFVEDSEFVEIDGSEHRLLLLQRGIICVKTKCSKKNKRESFTDIVFWMPWDAIRTIESKLKPERLKFFSIFAKDDVFKLDFELEHVREKIQGIILGVQIMPK